MHWAYTTIDAVEAVEGEFVANRKQRTKQRVIRFTFPGFYKEQCWHQGLADQTPLEVSTTHPKDEPEGASSPQSLYSSRYRFTPETEVVKPSPSSRDCKCWRGGVDRFDELHRDRLELERRTAVGRKASPSRLSRCSSALAMVVCLAPGGACRNGGDRAAESRVWPGGGGGVDNT